MNTPTLSSFSPLPSFSSFSRPSTAAMASAPFSNSDWHLLRMMRRKVTFFGSPVSGSASVKSGSSEDRKWHSCAYSAEKVGSDSALSKT